MEIITALFPFVFMNNLAMTLVKFLAQKSVGMVGLRVGLAALSIAGAIAASSLTGEQLDWNQLSDWGKLILEASTLWVASHYSYRAIKTA